ncbi:GNAT family N-acetyltransferase [Agromyces sp. H66]|uniref:GNAT family N-acetyltransferase n=1 Tax=Agromyces sp. H66 TaxID=2529859 RepID=UPI0010AA3028|nr:GNAT family N-acetyltransferase [Agromyces sp. H66]
MLVRLGEEDWAIWRAARLAALADSVEAFPNAAVNWTGGGEVRWRDRLLDATALKIVAIGIHEDPVGLVRGVLDGDWAWLHSLWVRPDHRRNGLGGRLIAAVEDWARPTAAGVRLEVVPGNSSAIALYRGRGYVTTEMPGTPLTGHGRELVMEKVFS